MVRYHDQYGTKDTISFNPVLEFKEDSWVIEETDLYLRGSCYPLPKFYVSTPVLWVDFVKGCYTDREIGLSAGSFKVLWVTDDIINVVRYVDYVKDEVKEPEKIEPIKQTLVSKIARWLIRRLHEIS